MHVKHLNLLVCPADKTPLVIKDEERIGDFVKSGLLVSAAGRSYPIRNFIPRFANDGYAESFSVEWEKHPNILKEATSSFSSYRHRFLLETKWSSDLAGQTILEAGCGPGSLTSFALETGATVVSFDLSNSVAQASDFIGRSERSLILQASLFEMPFKSATFDKAYCFGVIQHTPDPTRAICALSDVLKVGGSLAADSYIAPDPTLGGGHTILRAKYRFRKYMPDLPPRILHKLVKGYVGLMFPIYKAIRDRPGGAEMMRRFLFDEYRQRMQGMDEKFHREFAVLDIFDFLSPRFDIPQTVESFKDIFERAGMIEIDIHPGWNGIEGRGLKG
jgi:SAM-dependent methyltransferase